MKCILSGIVFLSCVLSWVHQVRAADPSNQIDLKAVRLAVRDLAENFPGKYPNGEDYLRRLDQYQNELDQLPATARPGDSVSAEKAAEILAFRRKVLLENPLLDIDRVMLIKRKPVGDAHRPKGKGKGLGEFLGLPRQSSWQQDNIPKFDGWENQIAVLSNLGDKARLRTLFKPATPLLVGDVELNFDADKILFSMPIASASGEKLCLQVFEVDASGGNLRQLSPRDQPGIHNFDACYLPDGRIVFVSTAPLQGVPCNASVNTALTYRMDADGSNVRQLCFDQDHNYCLGVANDGRVIYLRWEYTDIPHVWGRYLFSMNPDGTGQRALYGSGAYWPNSIFYARAIPNHPTKVVGIVTGHHVGRVGELLVFDPARGRNSTAGVVQRIPGCGKKVEPLVQDKLTEHSWPKFLHPYPLSTGQEISVACFVHFV